MVYLWNVSDSELEAQGLHKHCYKCFNLDKCRGGEDACAVVSCRLGCNFKFHQCKESEHQLLCRKEVGPCLNVNFGCDITLPRYQMTKHLAVCPASVVVCTHEWNRWPLFCRERFKSIPFRRKNPLAASGDLDLELAMRDQRMVQDFSKVPRRTKLALRNNLTRRYPALPLPLKTSRKSTNQDRTVRTLNDIVKFEVTDGSSVGPQYGVAKLFLKQQEIQKRRWQEDVDTAIRRTGQPVPKKYWDYPEMEKGNIHKHCAYCILDDCKKEQEFNLTSCSMVACPFECGFNMHHCKVFEHSMICQNFEEEGEFDWMTRDRVMKKPKKDDKKAVIKFPDLFEAPTVLPSISNCKRGKLKEPPPPPPLPQDLQRVVQFDIRLETVTKLQQKPKAMYTFLCGQSLRRDQWESHCQNVHNDIHGGLNNWMVARCPLASYGCGFSFNRLYPGSDPKTKVVFSKSIDSFGIQPAMPEISNNNPEATTLTDLPVELLQIIISMLDSWSLNQLALVSRYLRDLTSTLLDSKGCVALQWERAGDGVYSSKRGWEVAYKRWFFSCHFNKISNWSLNVDGAISQHLKTCPYNDRLTCATPDKKSGANRSLLKALDAKLKLKRDSEWFIQ